MPIQLRKPTPADAEPCGRIIYEAFRCIAQQHNFPTDFPSVDSAIGMARAFIGPPCIFGVIAEQDGQIIGSNFLHESDPISGVGPITVDPKSQSKGVGRQLMQAVLEHGKKSAGIRLVQEAFNTTSMSLYASLGFEVKEPLVVLAGQLKTPSPPPPPTDAPAAQVRPLHESDLEACAALCRHVHHFDRTSELRVALNTPMFRPIGLWRSGQLAAYITAPTFWLLSHAVAQTDQDLQDLLTAAAAEDGQISLLLPTRQSALFRWCLGQGLRIIKPMTLMTIGEYQNPRGAWLPSVLY